MKILAIIRIKNHALYTLRKKRGLTLKELCRISSVNVNDIQNMESLRLVTGKNIQAVDEKLHKIAFVLDGDFDELFPAEYLDMLQQRLLPRRRLPYLWVKEISLNLLPPDVSQLQLPSPEDIFEFEDKKAGLAKALQTELENLTEKERQVLEMRFGLVGGHDYTLEEVGQHFKVSQERIRQIEAMALRKLRYPVRSQILREFL